MRQARKRHATTMVSRASRPVAARTDPWHLRLVGACRPRSSCAALRRTRFRFAATLRAGLSAGCGLRTWHLALSTQHFALRTWHFALRT